MKHSEFYGEDLSGDFVRVKSWAGEGGEIQQCGWREGGRNRGCVIWGHFLLLEVKLSNL